MKNLLKLEFRKLKHRKSFYICSSVILSILLLSALIINATLKLMPEMGVLISNSGIDLLLEGLDNSYFTLIMGIFTVLFVCEDYSGQIVKNIYARGYSQKNVYLSKLIATLVAASIVFLAVEVFAFLVGTLFFGVGEVENAKFLALLALQYIAAMAQVAFAFFVAASFGTIGVSLTTVILAPTVMSLLLTMVDALLRFDNFKLANYWVSSFLSDLSSLSLSIERMLACLVGSLAYIAIFVFAGMFFNKKIKL